jgi:hypothetical protein
MYNEKSGNPDIDRWRHLLLLEWTENYSAHAFTET